MGQETAGRFSEGKIRHDLVAPWALNELARVYTYGTIKYSDDNWWKQYDLIHYHRSIGPDYDASKIIAKKLKKWGIPQIMDLDDYWLPTQDHPAHMMIKNGKVDVKIKDMLRITNN